MTTLILGHALRTVTYTLELAKARYANRPLSVTICNANGELLGFARMDSARLLTIELTQRKTCTSNHLDCTMQTFLQRLQKEQLDISYFTDPRFTVLPSGVPTLHQGKCPGVIAVGSLSTQEDHDAVLSVAEILLKGVAQ